MIDAPRVLITRVSDDVPLPSYAHPGDAGADLTANEAVELAPGERAAVPTGIAIALPDGFAAFVHPRSGLAARHGLSMVNAPGTIELLELFQSKLEIPTNAPETAVTSFGMMPF